MMPQDRSTTTPDEARQAALAELQTTWGHQIDISLNNYGSIYLSMETTSVLCRFEQLSLGHTVVELESPVLLDFVPPPGFYEMLLLHQARIEFGSFQIGAGMEADQIMLTVNGRLFADGLTSTHLKRAISMIHRSAKDQIEILQRITPPLGGSGPYG